jgi:protein O-mannosyl-transferase
LKGRLWVAFRFLSSITTFDNTMKYLQSCRAIDILFCILMVGMVAGVYGQFLNSPGLFDDIPFFTLDGRGALHIDLVKYSLFEIRSLPLATFAWVAAFFEPTFVSSRIGNLALHAACVVALYFFLKSVFQAVLGGLPTNDPKEGLSPQTAAFFAALLFALHPVSTYAVGYLIQRTMLMATLFSLLSMIAYVNGSLKENRVWLWMAVPLFYLAAFSKEHAVALPLVLLALTVLLHADWRKKLSERRYLFVALAAVVVWVVLAKRGILGSVYEPAAQEMLLDFDKKLAYPLSVFTQAWLFFKYAFLWLFPNSAWMSIDMREPFARSLLSLYSLAPILFASWGVLAFWLLLKRGRQGMAGFALLFPWLMFFTEFSSVRIQESFVLYRSYLWAVGAFCLLPIVVAKVERKMAALVLSLVALALVPISLERLVVLSQPVFAWADAEKLVKGRSDLPGIYRIYYNKGTVLMDLGNTSQAITDFKLASQLNPTFADAYANLGTAYARNKDWDNAINAYKFAIGLAQKTGGSYPSAMGNLGLAYLSKEDWANSVVWYSAAIATTGQLKIMTDPMFFTGRAQAYEHLGDLQKSQADYKLACDLAKKGCDKLK